MKLEEINQYKNINETIVETLSQYDRDEMLNEGVITDILQKVSNWFQKRNIKEFKFKSLQKGTQYITAVQVGNRVELSEYDQNEMIDFRSFTNPREAEVFLEEKVDEGYKVITDKKQLRKAISVLLIVIGIGGIFASTWFFFGPIIITIYGFLNGLISVLGMAAQSVFASIGSIVGPWMNAMGVAGGNAAAGAISSAASTTASAIGGVVKDLAIASAGVAGGWATIKLGTSLEDGE